jgi:hypothetical protein
MKTKLIRDVPIGVLLIVVALWCISAVQYLSGWPNFLTLLGIIVSSVIAQRLIWVGLDVILGIEIVDKNGKE